MSNIARKCRGGAFTLIELLVVIAIITLLVSILLPSINRARELAQRAVCASNLNGIGKGLILFAVNNEQQFPKVPNASWGSYIGHNRDFDPYDEDHTDEDRCNSTNMYLLIRDEYTSAKQFICPSTSDTEETDTVNTGRWDFSSSTHISYGMQNPYGYGTTMSLSAPAGAIWLADGSPYVFADGQANAGQVNTGSSVVNWATGNEDDNKLNGNSPNHSREGQNVCYVDAHVTWQKRADCGVENDNIYTGSGEEDEVSQGGLLWRGNWTDPCNNRKDSYILP